MKTYKDYKTFEQYLNEHFDYFAEIGIPVKVYWMASNGDITLFYSQNRFRDEFFEDADFLLVGFGSLARHLKASVRVLRAKGIKAGMFRPITLFPFPEKRLNELADRCSEIMTVEMNMGQKGPFKTRFRVISIHIVIRNRGTLNEFLLLQIPRTRDNFNRWNGKNQTTVPNRLEILFHFGQSID